MDEEKSIYNCSEELLEADEISPEEEGFMQGYDINYDPGGEV